jgi:hypothetical protein
MFKVRNAFRAFPQRNNPRGLSQGERCCPITFSGIAAQRFSRTNPRLHAIETADLHDVDAIYGKRALPEPAAARASARGPTAKTEIRRHGFAWNQTRESLNELEFAAPRSARLRLAAASGISTVTELWPSG